MPFSFDKFELLVNYFHWYCSSYGLMILMRSNVRVVCLFVVALFSSFIAHRTLNAQEADNRHDEDHDAEIALLLVRSTTDNQMFITNNSKPRTKWAK